jgi:hypothetical protein
MRTIGMLMMIAVSGCASTWDTVSNRQWQRDLVSRPGVALFGEDPMVTLRTNPDGAARAKAMLKLTPPDRNSPEYAEIQSMLGEAATRDPSPVVRAAAMTALGQFRDDERTINILQNAFVQSTGQGLTVAGRDLPDQPGLNLFGPSGYPPEVVTLLKTRAIEAMAKADHPAAQPFIADLAMKPLDPKTATAVDRDVRLAAVGALKSFRSGGQGGVSAQILAGVMTNEMARDTAVANRAHEGLVSLTGHSYPMSSPEWGKIVSADMKIAPEPNAIQQAAAWFKKP